MTGMKKNLTVFQPNKNNTDHYENLANAIVLQAVKDWRENMSIVKKNQNNSSALYMIKQCENFFLGDWIKVLTKLDGRMILSKLKEQMENE